MRVRKLVSARVSPVEPARNQNNLVPSPNEFSRQMPAHKTRSAC